MALQPATETSRVHRVLVALVLLALLALMVGAAAWYTHRAHGSSPMTMSTLRIGLFSADVPSRWTRGPVVRGPVMEMVAFEDPLDPQRQLIVAAFSPQTFPGEAAALEDATERFLIAQAQGARWELSRPYRIDTRAIARSARSDHPDHATSHLVALVTGPEPHYLVVAISTDLDGYAQGGRLMTPEQQYNADVELIRTIVRSVGVANG